MRFFDGLYDWWYFDLPRRSKVLGACVVVVLVGAIGIWQLRSDSGSLEVGTEASTAGSDPDSDSATSRSDSALPGGDRAGSNGVASATTDDVVSTTAPRPSTTLAESDAVTTIDTAGTTTSSTTATTAPPAASAPETTATSVAVTEPPLVDSPGFPTSPDGTPLPLLAIFDTETITLSGQVPSEAARERLGSLAIANSQFPDAQLVDNMVVNPAVPISVGVRVIELNSARFPTASTEILPDHARELDRVVNIMNALPNITVLVIGHADQRGDEARNFAISDERARAVVNYLRFLEIAPTRMTSRAAGASDLLTLESDEAAFALNRRTEFIFYGLLIE